MKAKQMDTTKPAVLTRLQAVAKATGNPDHWAQEIHKLAVCQFVLDCANVTDKTLRDEVMAQFIATPSAFGCNASAMNQALGKPKAISVADKLDERIKGL